jgi:hypothetical protein
MQQQVGGERAYVTGGGSICGHVGRISKASVWLRVWTLSGEALRSFVG